MTAADAPSRYIAGAALISNFTDVIMSRHIELRHRSGKDTLSHIRTSNPWPKMRQESWRVVMTCPVCIQYNIATPMIGDKWPLRCSTRPNDLLSIDKKGLL
jgi:Integrase zinc binding domain